MPLKTINKNEEFRTEILNDLSKRCNFPDVGFAQKLDKIEIEAERMFNTKTVEGYISSMIIYHQLIDELIKILISCFRYYVQLRLFPYKINKRKTNGKLTRNMLEELSSLILNPKIELFINKCYEFNELRNITVHRLMKVNSVNSTLVKCKMAKTIFDEIFKIFDEIYLEILKSMQNKEYFNDIEKTLGIDSKKIENLINELKIKL
ncbi:MAG: hypothetical protein NTY74_08480 [Ignavibacteriae bacterium]|nr:hypothetical protein [Ignavibacteriota bacterium]